MSSNNSFRPVMLQKIKSVAVIKFEKRYLLKNVPNLLETVVFFLDGTLFLDGFGEN
ncbi:hypothetical protein V1477_016785 [Vespula maculifrons]|uniref:Uncharacterized protein n=1 Tax=Vespula maculifrons TaxID=7453 RepID=A0ABD2B451_VESMC